MESIRTTHIVSAFQNEMDWRKVDEYANKMASQDYEKGAIDFPPIQGFFTEYDPEHDGETIYNCVNIDNPIYIKSGERVFKVTNGHHRSFAACKANIWMLETEFDYSCKVS